MVQLWDHVEDIRPSIKTAYKMKEMLSGRGIPLIINNRVDVALAVNAEGVHLGQRDFPYQEARRLLGKRAILGFTVDTFEDVIAAENLDVDYLGVQVFPSKNTKPNHTHLWGIEGLRKVKSFSRHRVLAIGGINVDNLKAVATHLSLGPEGDGVAMVGQLWRGENPYGVAQRVHSIFNERWGGK